jgi:Cdc6-like AAA superfamily ATPase
LSDFNFDFNRDKPIIRPLALRTLAGNSSGNLRKALDVCRRAIELAELEGRKRSLLKPNPKGTARL